MPVVRPRVERPEFEALARLEHVHDLRLASEPRKLEAAARDLPETRQVRPDVVVLLRAAVRDAKSREHLVEDQDDPHLTREPPQLLQVVVLRRDHAGAAQDGLDDQRPHVVLVLLEDLRGPFDVVVRVDHDRVADRLGHPASVRHGLVSVHLPQRRVIELEALERVVLGAMVRAFRFRDLVLAREGPGDPHRVHRRLGAAVAESDLLHAREGLLDRLDVLDVQLRRDSEHRARLELLDHLEGDVPVVVA